MTWDLINNLLISVTATYEIYGQNFRNEKQNEKSLIWTKTFTVRGKKKRI